MRRAPTNRVRRVLGTLAVAAGVSFAAAPLRAQGGVTTSGGPELLVPVGAQATGMGEAVVADFLGSESVWWNPAALGRATRREIAIHHTQNFVLTGDALSVVLPAASIGTLALSVDLDSYGTQDITDATGTYGTFTPRATILAGSFAGHVGTRAYLGVNYKLYHMGISCSGGCVGVPSTSASTTALDLGVQVRVSRDSSLYVGAALRNVGPRLQVNDAPQADALPTRLDLGVTWAPHIVSLGPDAQLRLAAGVVNAIPANSVVNAGAGGSLGIRLGAELGWQQKVHVRMGYAQAAPYGSGPTIGVGGSTGRFEMDISRMFSDSQANTGQPPTYLSLRLVF